MGHPTISMALQASIRMLCSQATNSSYCHGLNTGLLAKLGIKPEQIEAMKADPSNAPLNPKEKDLLKFVLKATMGPHGVAAEDIDKLKAIGWSERGIFDATAHGARMKATNILFDTFKVECDY